MKKKIKKSKLNKIINRKKTFLPKIKVKVSSCPKVEDTKEEKKEKKKKKIKEEILLYCLKMILKI